MKQHITWSTLLALCIVLGLVGPGAAQQPRYGGTLRVAWEQDVTGFDPHWSPGLQVQYVVGNLFNSLVTIDKDMNYIPELAEVLGGTREWQGVCVPAPQRREIPRWD
jgi:ABC-type transport system substrate-binding protein